MDTVDATVVRLLNLNSMVYHNCTQKTILRGNGLSGLSILYCILCFFILQSSKVIYINIINTLD